jgi:hypothetical protein
MTKETRQLMGPINLDGDQLEAFLELVTIDEGPEDGIIRSAELTVTGPAMTFKVSSLFEDGLERLITLLSEGLEDLRQEEIRF